MGRAFSADKTKCNRSGRRESSAVRRNADAFRYEVGRDYETNGSSLPSSSLIFTRSCSPLSRWRRVTVS